MKHFVVAILFYAVNLFCIEGLSCAETLSYHEIELLNGLVTKAYILSNRKISVEIVPALGGKITKLAASGGDNLLSRSNRPRVSRISKMEFNKTEFDGIDEIFPNLNVGTYPCGIFKGVTLNDHGDLFSQEWDVVDKSNNSITLEADCYELPLRFRRKARLNGSRLELDYTVTNLSDKGEPLYWNYTFHPLFKTADGLKTNLSGNTEVLLSYNSQEFLGKRGAVTTWESLHYPSGRRFEESITSSSSKTEMTSSLYWKLFLPHPPDNGVSLYYPGEASVEIDWSRDVLPSCAWWTSEGILKGLYHTAPEPTTGLEESLEAAIEKGMAQKLSSGESKHWRITLIIRSTQND